MEGYEGVDALEYRVCVCVCVCACACVRARVCNVLAVFFYYFDTELWSISGSNCGGSRACNFGVEFGAEIMQNNAA